MNSGALILLFALPVLISLAGMVLLWLYYDARQALYVHRPKDKAKLYRCRHCGHVYAEPHDVPLAKCTLCGYLNEAIRR